jgi:DNA mismatch repair ATPase MutL
MRPIKIIFFIAVVFFLTACKTIPTSPDDTTTPKTNESNSVNTEATTQNTPPQASENNEATQSTENSSPQPTTTDASSNLTSEEQAQQLDQQLDERFADFDRLLLREREFLSEKQKEQGAPQSGGGGANGDLDGFEGLDDYGDIAGENNSSRSGGNGSHQTGGENAFPSKNTNVNTPPDLVNSKGDDVIARQLREAAQKEKDPVLREKLWDEYRKYKSGI